MERAQMEITPEEREIILAYRQGGPLEVLPVLSDLLHREADRQTHGKIIQLKPKRRSSLNIGN